MHEINKICHLKSSRSPLEDDAEKNFKNFGKFSFEHFIRSPARKWSIQLIRGPGVRGLEKVITGLVGT